MMSLQTRANKIRKTPKSYYPKTEKQLIFFFEIIIELSSLVLAVAG